MIFQPSTRLIKCGSYSSKMPKKIKQGGYCSLYVATDKMIVAPLKKDFLEWIIWIVSPTYAARSAFKKAEQNLSLPIDSILAQNKANYQILNSSVGKFEMQKGNKIIAVQTEDGKHGFFITKWEYDNRDAIVEDIEQYLRWGDLCLSHNQKQITRIIKKQLTPAPVGQRYKLIE